MILNLFLTTVSYKFISDLDIYFSEYREFSINRTLNETLKHLNRVLTGENVREISKKIFKEIRKNLHGLTGKEKVIYSFLSTHLMGLIYVDIANYWDNEDPGDPCRPVFTVDFSKIKTTLQVLRKLTISLRENPTILEKFFNNSEKIRWFTILNWGYNENSFCKIFEELLDQELHTEIFRSYKMEIPKFMDCLLAWNAKIDKLEGLSLETLDLIYGYSDLRGIALYFNSPLDPDS